MTDFGGMTVNERLVVSGLLDAFDGAARARDTAKMIEILMRVGMTPQQAEETARAVVSDPARYGLS